MLSHFRRLLVIVLLATGSTAWSQTLNLAHERVLVITHSDPGSPERSLTDLAEKLLQHFTPRTQLVLSSDYKAGMIFGFTKVVVLGIAFAAPVPEALLSDLLTTDMQIVWLGYGVGQLASRSPRFGFNELDFHETQNEAPTIVYEGKAYPTNLHGFSMVHVTGPSVKIWSVLMRKGEFVPHVLQGGNLWFVNSMLDNVWRPRPTIAPTLVFADILHEVFNSGVERKHRAVLRLEDVSTHIPAARFEAIVNYLESEKVPFAIGLIPNQQLADGDVVPLAEKLRLVRALRRAQDEAHGTIILHGFFHTFGSGEDYEFWDEERDAPLAGETPGHYACKLSRGIEILRDLGLRPRFWETPHYMASPLGYRTFGRFFSHVIENRMDENWTPYPFGPDQFGQVVISENLDYIAVSEGRVVERMLERARLLQIVRDAWAVGFAHPAVVPVAEIAKLVNGLRALGYAFEDVGRIETKVNSDYRPSSATERLNTAALMTRINFPMIGRWLHEATQAVRSVAFTASAWAGIDYAPPKVVEDPCAAILAARRILSADKQDPAPPHAPQLP